MGLWSGLRDTYRRDFNMATDAETSETQGNVPHVEGLTLMVTAVASNKKWEWSLSLHGKEVPDGSGRCNNFRNAIRQARRAAQKVGSTQS